MSHIILFYVYIYILFVQGDFLESKVFIKTRKKVSRVKENERRNKKENLQGVWLTLKHRQSHDNGHSTN
jgi:hypothetical protein